MPPSILVSFPLLDKPVFPWLKVQTGCTNSGFLRTRQVVPKRFHTALSVQKGKNTVALEVLPHGSTKTPSRMFPEGIRAHLIYSTNRLSTQYLPSALQGAKDTAVNHRSSPLVMRLYTRAWTSCEEKQLAKTKTNIYVWSFEPRKMGEASGIPNTSGV